MYSEYKVQQLAPVLRHVCCSHAMIARARAHFHQPGEITSSSAHRNGPACAGSPSFACCPATAWTGCASWWPRAAHSRPASAWTRSSPSHCWRTRRRRPSFRACGRRPAADGGADGAGGVPPLVWSATSRTRWSPGVPRSVFGCAEKASDAIGIFGMWLETKCSIVFRKCNDNNSMKKQMNRTVEIITYFWQTKICIRKRMSGYHDLKSGFLLILKISHYWIDLWGLFLYIIFSWLSYNIDFFSLFQSIINYSMSEMYDFFEKRNPDNYIQKYWTLHNINQIVM